MSHRQRTRVAHGLAKGALDSFSKYLAQELGPLGITSNVVRFLAREASGHVTGTYTPVCGGAYLP